MSIRANNKVGSATRDSLSGMATYVLTILKLIVFCIVAFGVLMGLFQSVKIGSFYGFVEGTYAGIMWALILVPILTILDLSQKLKCYIKYGSVDFRVNQERRFGIRDNYSRILSTLRTILESHKRVRISEIDVQNGIIEALTSRSWRSFGERIEIKLFKGSSGKVTVTFSSKSRVSLAMLDYCRNFENAELFMKHVRERFGCNVAVF